MLKFRHGSRRLVLVYSLLLSAQQIMADAAFKLCLCSTALCRRSLHLHSFCLYGGLQSQR